MPLGQRRFGMSTHLYHGQQLSRDHLDRAARVRCDRALCDPDALRLSQHERGRGLAAMARRRRARAPRRSRAGDRQLCRWALGPPLTRPAADPEIRATAVEETNRCSSRAASRCKSWSCTSACRARSRPRLATTTAMARGGVSRPCNGWRPLGVRVAVEVIPNELSRAGSLVGTSSRRPRRTRSGSLPRLRARAHGR